MPVTAVRFANAVITACIIACLGVIAYAVSRYGFSPDRYVPSPWSFAVFYLAPLILLVCLSMALRSSPAWRLRTSLMLISSSLSILAIETVVSALPAPDGSRPARRAVAAGIPYDMRSKLDVLTDLHASGIPAVPNVVPARLLVETDGGLGSRISVNDVEVLPLSGLAGRLTVLCNESGKWIMYQSDAYGFRNGRGVWDAPSGTVAAIGDSFTQGVCVEAGLTFVERIRESYPATVNLGMVHNGPLAELGTLKEYVRPHLRPRIVLWFYFEGNDLDDLVRERRSPLLLRYLEREFSQDLLHLQEDVDAALSAYLEDEMRAERAAARPPWRLHPRSIARLEHLRGRFGLTAIRGVEQQREWGSSLPLFRQIIAEADETVREWGGRLYFVYLPEWLRYAHPGVANVHRDAVLALVDALGVPVIDIHDVFSVHADPVSLFPFREGSHYTDEGHRLIADEVRRMLAVQHPPDPIRALE